MKETIINGIDVSECAYYNKDNEPYCCEIWENECEAQNCYFKQLKRLQEENEDLKKENILLKNDIEGGIREYESNEKIHDYKQALEEIREIVSDTCRKRCTNECLGTKKHCGYGKILNKINEVLK